jgi:hypothetical protein
MELKLKNVRLSFPDLFKPRPFKPGDTPKYKATFLIPKDDPQIKVIEAAIVATAKEKWPKDFQKVLNSIRGNANKFCYQDGDNKSYDGYEGMMALSAGNKVRPSVFDRDRSPLTEDDGKPYAGCYVNAIVELFAYDNSGNGISASLSGVQFYKDGEAFSGGRPAAADAFDDLSVEDEDNYALT